MVKKSQIKKAEDFLALHHARKLLVLPNIWDPLGAQMLQYLGYPAVATASAAVAFSLGYDDGQKIAFKAMLDVIARIASSVDVPLTADIERGYADDPVQVAENVQKVLLAGAVGVNLEDSTIEGGDLFSTEFQCDRIRAVRQMADREGIPLVINARIDTFLRANREANDNVSETISRGQAYLEAGADCLYPIGLDQMQTLQEIVVATNAPVNVYAQPTLPSIRELEAAGISRLSLGPGFLKAGLGAMKQVAVALRNYNLEEAFPADAIDSSEIREFISKERMP